jgi:hypothetical protein
MTEKPKSSGDSYQRIFVKKINFEEFFKFKFKFLVTIFRPQFQAGGQNIAEFLKFSTFLFVASET